MTKLDLEDDNVHLVQLSVRQAREVIDNILPDDLLDAFDEAQAPVCGGSAVVAYVVIAIRRS